MCLKDTHLQVVCENILLYVIPQIHGMTCVNRKDMLLLFYEKILLFYSFSKNFLSSFFQINL